MKKRRLLIITVVAASLLNITAIAGQWKQDARGWWYDNGDGTYPTNTWQWLDGNNDGMAECYYFGSDGYMVSDTVTPDGIEIGQGTINDNTIFNTNAALNNKNSIIYTANFDPSNIRFDGSRYTITFTPYQVRIYPKAYLMALKPGTTIANTIVENVREEGNSILIDNEGMVSFDKLPGANDLYTAWENYDGGGLCYTNGAPMTLPMSSSTVYTDTVYNLASGGFDRNYYSILNIPDNGYGFNDRKAVITVQNGEVVDIIHPFES